MSSRTPTYIFDRHAGKYVDSTLIDELSKQEVEAAEKAWRPVMDAAVQKKKDAGEPVPQHAHWDWRKKHAACEGLLIYQFLGVECAGQMQGMMLLETAGVFCRHIDRIAKGLVYVTFIATAPWNSPDVVPDPRYKQVGTVLIRAAIEISADLGFSGCIGLHSLPRAEDWYGKKCGMTDLGADVKKKMRYYEMTAEQADAFRRGDDQ